MGNKKRKLIITKRSKDEAIKVLKQVSGVWEAFCSLDRQYQDEIVSFCMGERGLKITYDTVFKMVMNPKKYPERLESFLSAILGEEIKIIEILDRKGVRMSESASIVIVDILVKTVDGRYINVEMQKVGYAFPLSRTDCYVSDLIMRQYNDIKKDKKDSFRYSDLTKVITIIIMEKSFGEFLRDTTHAIHHRTSVFDTGLSAEGLSENYYICLDTYQKFIHTEIKDKKEAWLSFFSSNRMEDILEVCDMFPEFTPLYEDIFKFQNNVGRLINMFSEAIQIMDRNTERYMIEIMKQELDDTTAMLQQRDEEYRNEIQQRDMEIAELRRKLAELQK